MIPPPEYSVTVCLPGYGRFSGGTYDIYTDMLVRYPNYEVKFEKR